MGNRQQATGWVPPAPVTGQDIVRESRTWFGTPWVHQGRLKGVACDCVGFVICVPRALGIFPPDFNITGYSRNPEPKVMGKFLDMYLDRVNGEARGGDVLWLRPRRLPQHLAILTFDNTMIHAIDEVRGVREHILDTKRYPIAAVFKYRGLAD